MVSTPAFFKDTKDLLTPQGFSTSNIWYHGTSSTLVDSIKAHGLMRSGDKALNDAAKKTMKTIGNNYEESVEPVFLTQSKELAFYWAKQTVRNRNVRADIEEAGQPSVIAVKLPEALNKQVEPDVGAASILLLKEGEDFMVYLANIYQENNCGIPEINLIKADRLEYLQTLGMAYLDADIDTAYLEIIAE